MPTTIKEIFNSQNIGSIYKVKWGENITSQSGGIYIVSTSSIPSQNLGISSVPNIDDTILIAWIKKVQNFTIDGERNFLLLKKRLKEFWLPDENILYIGKATVRANGKGLGKRISEYYTTKIGAGSPHSGGQWIKTLKNLDKVYVYYGFIDNSSKVEEDMLKYFIENVSDITKEKLRDKNLPLPFANIRYKGTTDKNHGMLNQRL